MSSRVGPLIIAISSVAVRISGDNASADILALAALGMLTMALQRTGGLQEAATAVRANAALDAPHHPNV
jgi:hypothetical protein